MKLHINTTIDYVVDPIGVNYYNVSIIAITNDCTASHVNSCYSFGECVEFVNNCLGEYGKKLFKN